MDPFTLAREFWRKAIKPLFVTERRETLFGTRYNKMNDVKATLGPLEQQRLRFYLAASHEDEPIRDYIAYIQRLAHFCETCVRNPESHLAQGLDMACIARFKVAVDLAANALRQSDKAYLDRIRNEMGAPPLDDDMARRVRRAEIAMIKQDIGQNLPRP